MEDINILKTCVSYCSLCKAKHAFLTAFCKQLKMTHLQPSAVRVKTRYWHRQMLHLL